MTEAQCRRLVAEIERAVGKHGNTLSSRAKLAGLSVYRYERLEKFGSCTLDTAEELIEKHSINADWVFHGGRRGKYGWRWSLVDPEQLTFLSLEKVNFRFQESRRECLVQVAGAELYTLMLRYEVDAVLSSSSNRRGVSVVAVSGSGGSSRRAEIKWTRLGMVYELHECRGPGLPVLFVACGTVNRKGLEFCAEFLRSAGSISVDPVGRALEHRSGLRKL